MEQKVILSLDTATTTGWALRKDKSITYGHWRLKEKTRNAQLETNIENMIREHGVNTIVAEDVHKVTGKGKAYEVLCSLRGNIEAVAQRNNIPITYVEPINARRQLFKSDLRNKDFNIWNVTKADIQRKIKERYRRETETHDEADALAQLFYYIDRYRV